MKVYDFKIEIIKIHNDYTLGNIIMTNVNILSSELDNIRNFVLTYAKIQKLNSSVMGVNVAYPNTDNPDFHIDILISDFNIDI